MIYSSVKKQKIHSIINQFFEGREAKEADVAVNDFYITIRIPRSIDEPEDVVEITWNTVKLDKEIARYIAEDKELEYES